MRLRSLRSLVFFGLAFLLGGWIIPNLRVSWGGPQAHASPFGEPDLSRLNPEEVYARAAAIAGRSVVNIDTEKRVRVRSLFFDDDDFFGGPRYRRVAGSGSGVIVSSDGDILTNAHVVEGADTIAVTLPDGRQFKGRVIGSDHSTDVALVKVDGSNLPAAHIGTSQGLVPGQIAVAIGNPLGLRFTVTHGIVSALGRPIKLGDRVYENLIQIDCPINPGNSGGALVDRNGQVIGINTLVAEAANGVGFAIPIDTAQRIASELRKYGKVKRPWTGLYCGPVTPDIQRYFGLDRAEGAFVEGVVPDSPADQAGIRRGDILLEMNGQKVRDDDDLRHMTEKLKIGQKVTVRIRRGDQMGAGEMTIRESP
jgi:serine protease Do